MDKNQNLINLINEELSKTEITALINKKFDEKISSKELEKKIKALSASVLEEFLKILWQRKSFWQDSVKR